jgi:hypothetical protein
MSRIRRPVTRRLARLGVVGVLLAGALTASGSAPPGEASSLPRVQAIVECKIASTGPGVDDVYWFSYVSDGLYNVGGWRSSSAGIYSGPALVGSATNHPVQFLPGSHQMAFAVAVAPGQSVRWSVTIAESFAQWLNGAYTSVADTDLIGPIQACPAITARVSATASGTPVVSTINERQVRNGSGLLTEASVRFELQGVASRCTGAATPLPPLVLWGFNGDDNVVPPPPWVHVRTDTLIFSGSFGSVEAPFPRTWVPIVTIVNPQEPFTNTLGETYYGKARIEVIADVYARCRGTDGRVYTSVQPYYVNTNGESIQFRWYTFGTPQTTTAIPASCREFEPGPTVSGCPYDGGFFGNGSARARR